MRQCGSCGATLVNGGKCPKCESGENEGVGEDIVDTATDLLEGAAELALSAGRASVDVASTVAKTTGEVACAVGEGAATVVVAVAEGAAAVVGGIVDGL